MMVLASGIRKKQTNKKTQKKKYLEIKVRKNLSK